MTKRYRWNEEFRINLFNSNNNKFEWRKFPIIFLHKALWPCSWKRGPWMSWKIGKKDNRVKNKKEWRTVSHPLPALKWARGKCYAQQTLLTTVSSMNQWHSPHEDKKKRKRRKESFRSMVVSRIFFFGGGATKIRLWNRIKIVFRCIFFTIRTNIFFWGG